MKILIEADRVLHALFVDLLFEISVAIEQTDRDEIQIQIARGFAMVAGENAKAAGIIRNRFVKTKFGGEISDRFFDRAPSAGFPVSVRAGEITAVGLVDLFQFAKKILVLRDLDEPRLPGKLEHPDGIVVRLIPQCRIEMAKETARGGFPGPPEVEDHFPERLERRREGRDHVIRVVGGHWRSFGIWQQKF